MKCELEMRNMLCISKNIPALDWAPPKPETRSEFLIEISIGYEVLKPPAVLLCCFPVYRWEFLYGFNFMWVLFWKFFLTRELTLLIINASRIRIFCGLFPLECQCPPVSLQLKHNIFTFLYRSTLNPLLRNFTLWYIFCFICHYEGGICLQNFL
jgi:hypothetical protein